MLPGGFQMRDHWSFKVRREWSYGMLIWEDVLNSKAPGWGGVVHWPANFRIELGSGGFGFSGGFVSPDQIHKCVLIIHTTLENLTAGSPTNGGLVQMIFRISMGGWFLGEPAVSSCSIPGSWCCERWESKGSNPPKMPTAPSRNMALLRDS